MDTDAEGTSPSALLRACQTARAPSPGRGVGKAARRDGASESALAMTPAALAELPATQACRALAVIVMLAALPLLARAQTVKLESETLPEDVRAEIGTAMEEFEPPETPLAARRVAQRAVSLARTVLNANGYFDPVITSGVEPGPPPRPVLEIDPGPLFEIGGIRVDYAGTPPGEDAQYAVERAITLAPGVSAIPSRVIDQEAIIIDALRRAGYPDADILGRETTGRREAGTIDVRYRVRSGPPVLLGEVRFETTGQVRDSFLERFLTFPPGTPYAPAELDRLRERLTRDRLFRSVQVSLIDTPVRIAPGGAEVRDVRVRLEARRKNRVAAGVSFATDEGAGIRLEYERRDLSRRADTVRSELAIADLRRELAVTWDRPHEFGFGRDLELTALVAEDNTDAFESQRAVLAALVEHTVSQSLSFTYGVSGEILQETIATDARSSEVETRDVQILSLLGGARIDRADDPLDPSRGWRADATVEPSITQGDVSTQLLRLNGQVRGYQPIGVDERVIAALRMRAGAVLGGSFIDIPSELRFFGGGGGSVRGYEFQSIGPTTPDGQPVGGQAIAEVSAELRYRMGERLGLVAFVDGGQVTDDTTPTFDSMRFGAGIGVRYQTVAGPIRFDIATPLDPRDGDDPVQIYLSVGQAF